MQKLCILLMIIFTLTGCIRKIAIEQGNIMTPEMINQVHVGMNEAEVKQIMGSPVLMNTFRDNRVDYVYTFKPGRGTTTEKYFTLIFQNGRLISISGNMYSHLIN
jgi:outer membrane protein assembly factor BamE